VSRAVEILETAQNPGAGGEYILSAPMEEALAAGASESANDARDLCCDGREAACGRGPHMICAERRNADRGTARVGGEQLIKRVLGHTDGSVTAIYNRYGYVKEMRAVLARWQRT